MLHVVGNKNHSSWPLRPWVAMKVLAVLGYLAEREAESLRQLEQYA
ncbi:MAG TPA: hypothetical protein VLA30_05500 [Burkholderiales bacterium]|nr:hypothetical protein [Burkholderiales bacterium]